MQTMLLKMNKKKYIKFLEVQGAYYVWQFTKQDVNFENAFNATKLFEEWNYFSDKSNSLDEFYKIKHETYGLVNNYRALIISQLYGLLSKKTNQYKNEEITPVFEKIATSENPKQFSVYISEQILKIKLPAITYSKSERPRERHIFPIIFIFQILRKLPKNKISIQDLFAFVMTMDSHSELDFAIKLIASKSDYNISNKLFADYKGISRVIALIKNIDLFKINADYISLNQKYIKNMDSFLRTNLFYQDDELKDKNKYKHFLITPQNFGINLKENLIINENLLPSSIKEDNDYVVDVNNVNIKTIDSTRLNLAYDKKPILQDTSISKYKRNPEIGKLSIINSKFKCKFDEEHKTFISRVTKKNYVEAHHLIPMQHQNEFWKKYSKNIDCIQNVVSLCPICHRALHHGILHKKKVILEKLYEIKEKELQSIGIKISKEELYKYYF